MMKQNELLMLINLLHRAPMSLAEEIWINGKIAGWQSEIETETLKAAVSPDAEETKKPPDGG